MLDKSKTKQIQEKLRNIVLIEEKFKPGDKLPNENVLTQIFEVSRPVIREALNALVAQGVLETRHGSGTYVAENPGFANDPLGLSDIQDKTFLLKNWYEARRAVESEVIRMVVANATSEDLKKLQECSQEVELAMRYGDSAFLKSDRKFHILLAKATHNPVMERLIIVLMSSFYYTIADELPLTWIQPAMENARYHHKQILQTLFDRDEVSAVLAVRSHMSQALRDLQKS